MEALVRARRPVRHLVKKLGDELEVALAEDPMHKESVKTRLLLFEDCFESLWRHDRKIMEEMAAAEIEEEEENTAYEEMQEFRTRAMFLKQKASSALQEIEPASVTTASVTMPLELQKRNFKLPTVQMAKFNGKLIEWIPFWGQFKKIHEDETMDGSDKYWYLLQSMEPGTDVHKLVKAYPPSAENYPKVIATLKARYADDDLLLQVYVREILGLLTTKQKSSLEDLHTKLEANIYALRSLNLKKADPEMWLYLMAESALPEGILLNWHRSPSSRSTEVGEAEENHSTSSRLDKLMEFLGKERDARRKANFSKTFSEGVASKSTAGEARKPWHKPRVPLVAGFHSGDVEPCLFCSRTNHQPQDCLRAKRMTYEETTSVLKQKRLCFRCFGKHWADKCNTPNLSCGKCHGRHYAVMCPGERQRPTEARRQGWKEVGPPMKRGRFSENGTQTGTYSNQICSSDVSLQTVVVDVVADNRKRRVRAFLDCGSQRSYILCNTAYQMALTSSSLEHVVHSVFGGAKRRVTHKIYNVTIQDPKSGFQLPIRVRDEKKMCNNIPRAADHCTELKLELERRNIQLSDVGANQSLPQIEVVIGSDYYGKLMTGNKLNLDCGFVAIETTFGWTLLGAANEESENVESPAMTHMNMAVTDATVSELWDLEKLGIRDAAVVKTEEELNAEFKQRCFNSMTRKSDGRYCVRLPWKEHHPPLPSNLELAREQMKKTSEKLTKLKLKADYGKLFQDWENEGFIERSFDKTKPGHYIPHRAVIKPTSPTTPIRPVFNASFKRGSFPSLNQCLHKGVNLIQKIPEILLQFREKKVAFVADIRKAFQMIEVAEEDRDAMRFLWMDDDGNEIHYRHCRVMFGATCSPFLLGAVLEHFLSNITDERREIALTLLRSLYVDNCVCSVDTHEDYLHFKEVSVNLLKEIQMDLRLWFSNTDYSEGDDKVVPVLGMLWDRQTDEMYIKADSITQPDRVTKKEVLSAIQKIYDPLGIVSPAVLPMKLLLQQTCVIKLKWNDKLPTTAEDEFRSWIDQVKDLKKVKIPRCFTRGQALARELHIFTDASQFAYGALIFVRNQYEQDVETQLLMAKSRVAPIQKITIPRLELISCVIGARLAKSLIKALKWNEVNMVYWSDSTTALAWIRRNDDWGTFVGNRCQEIRNLVSPEYWKHVPGRMNPADLPSRGCSIQKLAENKWWKGPIWLSTEKENWPSSEPEVSEMEVAKEMRKSTEVTLTCSSLILDKFSKQYSFQSTIRIVGWVRRFLHNKFLKDDQQRQSGPLVAEELHHAEIAVIRSIQVEHFPIEDRRKLHGLEVIEDQFGALRVKTRLTNRSDTEEFKFPFLLPGKSPLVQQLIHDFHEENKHAGVGILLSILRQKYWILHGRKSINSVISKCVRCRRFSAKSIVTECAPLPENRVKDAAVFQTTGVDLFGPLFLKGGKKIWVTIFTCAVYRAVHFETVTTLSTGTFLNALKRFVDKFRRPEVIYCDNGTNFRGAESLLKKLNWKYLTEKSEVKPILFKFSPPISAWWGGWWERLIRTAKDLMRKSLGKASLTKSELESLLGEVATVMNARPLTYISENPADLETLTPSHFLDILGKSTFPEKDMNDAEKLRFRWKYVKTLEEEIKKRFRNEYLALLVSHNQKKSSPGVKVGDIVFVGDDKTKRIYWPMARVLNLYPGRDGVNRVAKVKTASGELIRTVQRLYPLEADHHYKAEEKAVITRSGRIVKRPERWGAQ